MLPSYSPKEVKVAFNGITITGFAPDSMVRLKRTVDHITPTVGSQGDLSLTKVADRTGEIEIELMQTAESNALLAAIVYATELGGDIVVGVLTIQDPSGSVLAIALNSYIKGLPDIDLGAEQNTKVWMFGCETLEYSATSGLI